MSKTRRLSRAQQVNTIASYKRKPDITTNSVLEATFIFSKISHVGNGKKRGGTLYCLLLLSIDNFEIIKICSKITKKIMKCKNLIYTFFLRCKLCFHALLRVISASNIGPTNNFWYALLVQTKHSKVRL